MKLSLVASYPKSGSTWLRALLTNYFSGLNEPVNINSFMGQSTLINRHVFDEEMGVDSSLLSSDAIDLWRPDYCRHLCHKITEPTFLKIHDAYTNNSIGEPLFPYDSIDFVIYPVRNPFAVCVSFAHHSGFDIDKTIELMADRDAVLGPGSNKSSSVFPVKLLSWSGHVESWLHQTECPVLTVKYENLSDQTYSTFKKVLEFANLEVDEDRIQFAVTASNFALLKRQEMKTGFRERNPSAPSFFRSGETDGWKDQLSDKQKNRIESDHGAMMQRLGYL